VGAAFSSDKRRQHGAFAIFAAGSRSHQGKAVFLQKIAYETVLNAEAGMRKADLECALRRLGADE